MSAEQHRKTEATMIVRQMRLDKGWSQEHLAQISGLSVRTVQRIERGQKAGLESLKCLAAVFETDVSKLTQEQTMTDTATSTDDTEAAEYALNLQAFGLNLIVFIVVMPALYALNYFLTPAYIWAHWVALAWGASFVLHAVAIAALFGIFNTKWEENQTKGFLNRNR